MTGQYRPFLGGQLHRFFQPDLLEIVEKSNITLEHRFLDVIAKNGYQTISVKTQNGNVVDYENKIMKKLNKGTK